MKIKLSNEIEYKGKKVHEVEVHVENLKGSDLIAAEKQARMLGDQTPQVYVSSLFQAIVAAKLLGITIDDFEEWPANDFSKLIGTVTRFLFEMA